MLSVHWGSRFVTSYPWCGCITVLLSHHYAIGACFRRIFKTVLGCFILEKDKVDLWFFPCSTSVVRDTNTNHYQKKRKKRVYFTLLSNSKKLSVLFSFLKEQHFFLLSTKSGVKFLQCVHFAFCESISPAIGIFHWTLEK